MMNLFSPQVEVLTSKYCFTGGFEVEINSCEDTYYDWAKLRFVSPMEHKVTIPFKEKVAVHLGYNGNFESSFTGYATTDFVSGRDANEIILKDGMLLLEDVKVNSTFTNASPQEIVRYCTNLAGIAKVELASNIYQPKARLPIVANGISAIKSLGSAWRINPKFFFQDDTFYWGCAPKQSKLCCFEYAKNIISFDLTDGYWQLETVSVPFIKHSQVIQVSHPKASGTFKVHRVRVNTQSNGFIRSTLFCKAS